MRITRSYGTDAVDCMALDAVGPGRSRRRRVAVIGPTGLQWELRGRVACRASPERPDVVPFPSLTRAPAGGARPGMVVFIAP